MTGTAKAGTAGQRRAVFAVDEDAALAALDEAWADGGYHALQRRPRHLVGDRQRRSATLTPSSISSARPPSPGRGWCTRSGPRPPSRWPGS